MFEESRKEFYKRKPTDKVYWVDYIDEIGRVAISFDKKKIYNLWSDYPWKLTAEEKELFDKENPFGAEFFSDRE